MTKNAPNKKNTSMLSSSLPEMNDTKDLEKMIGKQMDERLQELAEYAPRELKELVLFLENRMAIMMVELELTAMLDRKKEELLNSDISEEDLEEQFEALQEEIEAQMEGSGAFVDMFDAIFEKKASPKMVELLLNDADDEEQDA